MEKNGPISREERADSVRPKGRAIRPFKLNVPDTAEDNLLVLELESIEEFHIHDLQSTTSEPITYTDEVITEIESQDIRFVPVMRPVQRSVPLIPLQFRTLQEALDGCREMHPLPFELVMGKAPHHTTWLMAQVKNIKSQEQLYKLANSLSYRDLSLLFTTLSTLKRRDETDQIQNLIRLRACHYLYLCGWLTLQHCYPRSSVARALADLCIILEDIKFVRDSNHQGKRQQLALPLVPIGHGRIIWSRVPLISEISLPNSRHFITDIASEIYESKIELNAFLHQYAIFPGLPLGDAIITRYEEMVTGISANPLLSQDFFDRFRSSRS
ncbi:MAG: hypothetical protein GX850_05955 [Clostridiaceae bacterium]|nr:hypothetical protein [Clostridiaceae bacterium]